MSKKQTAVEWLEDNLIGNPFNEQDFTHNVNVFKQAKQMEKNQICNAYLYGAAYGIDLSNNLSPNNYFTEVYDRATDPDKREQL